MCKNAWRVGWREIIPRFSSRDLFWPRRSTVGGRAGHVPVGGGRGQTPPVTELSLLVWPTVRLWVRSPA